MFNKLWPDELELTVSSKDDEHKLGDGLLELGWEMLVLDELYGSVLGSDAAWEEDLVDDGDGWSSVEIRLFKTLLVELELVVNGLGSGVELTVLLVVLLGGGSNICGSSVGMKEWVEVVLKVLLVVLFGGGSNNCGSIISTLNSSCRLETEKLIQSCKNIELK